MPINKVIDVFDKGETQVLEVAIQDLAKNLSSHTHDGISTPTIVAEREAQTVVTLDDAATISTNCGDGTHFRVTLGGNRTLGNPINATDGERYVWEIIQDGTGNRTISLGSKFNDGSFTITLSTTGNLRDFLEAIYNIDTDKFYIVSFVKGY